mmetsp:Transcript_5630/g.14434  ORF Transcript_5630/g.14434 Transcript_5630/m.14434 type:complete len:250 (+) Transcript_5630:2087-2836(+)
MPGGHRGALPGGDGVRGVSRGDVRERGRDRCVRALPRRVRELGGRRHGVRRLPPRALRPGGLVSVPRMHTRDVFGGPHGRVPPMPPQHICAPPGRHILPGLPPRDDAGVGGGPCVSVRGLPERLRRLVRGRAGGRGDQGRPLVLAADGNLAGGAHCRGSPALLPPSRGAGGASGGRRRRLDGLRGLLCQRKPGHALQPHPHRCEGRERRAGLRVALGPRRCGRAPASPGDAEGQPGADAQHRRAERAGE